MDGAELIRARRAELVAAFALLTRLPVSLLPTLPQAAPGANAWAYPLVGATVGAIGGAVYWLAASLDLPPALASLIAIAARTPSSASSSCATTRSAPTARWRSC